MNLGLSFDPFFGWTMLAVLAALGIAAALVLAYTRSRGWYLRALTIALALLALANPSIRSETREALSDIAIAVIDRSLSQNNGDRTAQVNAAEERLKAAAAALGNTELRVVTVKSGQAIEDEGTQAFAALSRAMAEVPPERFAGAIMVTDGQVHDVPQDVAKAGVAGPLHAIITGSQSERDRRVVVDQAPRFGIVGKEQTIRFHVQETGGPNQPMEVTITSGNGQSVTMSAAPGAQVEVPVLVDHGGQNIWEISVAPLEGGEVSLQNNLAIVVVDGVRDRLRVLLVSGEPHPGERTWRNLLKADASVDLVHFTILRPPEKQDGTPIKELALIAFPTRELFIDKLEEFDLVIFDRYRRQAVLPLNYLANVANYVSQGGAVLIASGPDFAAEDGLYNTPLADVMPAAPLGGVFEGGFRPEITDSGKRHPVTRALPGGEGETPKWGRWFRVVNAAANMGDVVMNGPEERPLLVLSRQGEGRVAQMLSDHGWLWARGFEGGGPQTELLRRIAHWLMKEPDLEEEALGGTQSGGKLTIERRTMASSAKPVTVTLPSGKDVEVPLAEETPGIWRGRIDIEEAGLHRLSDGTLKAVAAAGDADAREASDIIATASRLTPVAELTGGGVQWFEDGMPRLVKVEKGRTMAGSGWMGLRNNDAYRVTAVTELPLFATLAALAALLAAACAMWYREGR
ncbi:MAG: hypothetical protein ACKVP5_15385 [Aestuariivirga sp.]